MNVKNINLFTIFLCLISISLNGQHLTGKKLTADLWQLKKSIELYNPALEIYNPEFKNSANSLIAEVPNDSIPLTEAFTFFSRMCALSNEGHFSLGNWSDDVHTGFLRNEYKYLPLSVRITEKKFYVWFDNSNEQLLKRGDEIISLDGRSPESILNDFYSIIPSDGEITTYINRKLELDFSWMYYLFISRPEQFQMEVKDSSCNTKKIKIKALIRDEQFENFAEFYPERQREADEDKSFYTLVHKEDVSLLTLPSFDYRKIKENNIKSKKLYKTIFREIQETGSRYLVIDLRGNTGGRNEFADDMVPFVLKEEDAAPFLKKTISWSDKEKKYRFPGSSKFVFKGRVFVLVNGRTYSAGSTLSRYLNEYADAVIIGEETGTRYEGFAAGSKQLITLENSKIKIGIPRYHILFPESVLQTTENRGLLPDVAVQYSIVDLIGEVDRHLEKANSLIEKHRKTNQDKGN